MLTAGNHIQNNSLAAMASRASPEVLGAIRTASVKTGVDFAYLLEKADAESSFRPGIKSKTSSATGLFQFIESTWLQMVREHGHKYGLGQYAEQISTNGKVKTSALRKEILELRKDPEMASLLAAEYAAGNQRFLEQNVKGDQKIGATELYLAHFMGPSGAAGFLNAHNKNPLMTAADIFPKAARANYNVFYDSKTGQPRTLAGVYDFFDKKFKNSGSDDAVMVASKPAKEAPVRNEVNSISEELWAHTLFQNNRNDSLRLLAAQTNDNEDRSARRPAGGGIARDLVASPVEIMMMAQLDNPLSNRSFND